MDQFAAAQIARLTAEERARFEGFLATGTHTHDEAIWSAVDCSPERFNAIKGY